MSLLALSAIAAFVGVAIVAFLVVRFVMKVVWKLAMFAAVLVFLLALGVGGYVYYRGAELPALPTDIAP